MPAVTKPTLPDTMTPQDLEFSALMDVMIADLIYFTVGAYPSEADIMSEFNKDTASTMLALDNAYILLGELAEKPGKADSKINKLKTRNYSIPGKRTSTIELNIVGLSNLQKDYLESAAFQGTTITIVSASKDLRRVVVFNGMRWTVDWSGEADGLFNVVISTEFSGTTKDRIVIIKDVPDHVT